ncbi:hypothetical protein ACIRFF_16285 [Streptomyces cyaneofuscatus]
MPTTGLAAVDRRPTGVGTPFSTQMWKLSTHAEFACRVQLREQDLVRLVEYTGLLPPPAPSADLPGAKPPQ